MPATQVAEWAGHSVEVLLSTYAKCIDGPDQELLARRRIESVLSTADERQDLWPRIGREHRQDMIENETQQDAEGEDPAR